MYSTQWYDVISIRKFAGTFSEDYITQPGIFLTCHFQFDIL